MTSYVGKGALMAGVAVSSLLLFQPVAAHAGSGTAGIIWQAGNDILQQQVNNATQANYGRYHRRRGEGDHGYDDRGGDDRGADRGDRRGDDRGGGDDGGGGDD
ncbi:MAG: hypothetical protein KGL10_03995 [Alphaproteobacteria bacterium]|nr:hypothetical protein [Alphaproteobacteria bacterium]